MQLLAQHIKEQRLGWANEADAVRRASTKNPVVFHERHADLAVHGEKGLAVVSPAVDGHHAGVGHNDRPIGERMRADGREAEGTYSGKNDGSSGRERVSSGAG